MVINKNLKNLISLFIIEFGGRFIAFLSVTYLANILGASNFGLINIGLALLSYAMIISTGGLTLLGTKKIAGKEGDVEKIVANIFSVRIILSLAVFVVAVILTSILVTSDEVSYVIIIYLIFLFPSAFLLEWFFHGAQRMNTIAAGRLLSSAVYLLFLLLFVKQMNDVLLPAVGWVLSGIINSLFLLYMFYKSGFAPGINLFSIDKSAIWGTMKESSPLGLATVIAQFVILFPVIYLGIAADTSESGIFSAAYKVIILLLIIDRIFNALFFPKIVQYYEVNKDFNHLGEIVNRILKLISFFILIISIFFISLADYLIITVFGSAFFDSIIVFQILVGVFYFTVLNSVLTYTLIAFKKEKSYTLALSIAMIFFLIAIFVLTKFYSSSGAAASMVIFESICFILMYFKIKKYINLSVFRSVILPVIIVIFFALLTINLKESGMILQIISGIIGLILTVLSTGINNGDIKFLKGIFT